MYNNSYQPHSVTASDDMTNDWATLATTSNFWIKVECPSAVAIWKFIVRGRHSGAERLLDWRLEGSNDNATWTALYTATNTPIGLTPLELTVSTASPVKYEYYRIFCSLAEVFNPGLSYWQLFSLDDLV